MKDTPLTWQPLWDAMEENPEKWVLTTENMYFDMLQVLPPRKMLGESFLVGEPLRHVNGEAVYACFTKLGDVYRAKNLTVREFLEAFA
jgi:hypothetical protein